MQCIWRDVNFYISFFYRPYNKGSPHSLRRRWNYSFNIDLREMDSKGFTSNEFLKDRRQFGAFVNKVANVQFYRPVEDFSLAK
jgi:hypothetical protein